MLLFLFKKRKTLILCNQTNFYYVFIYFQIQLWEAVKPGCTEADLHALFLYESSRHGAFFQSYFPIVGKGMNAATLHYNKNNALMDNPNDVVLVDAGAEYGCYASDITRCFPVNGKFTDEARVIYSIVLDMQKVTLIIAIVINYWKSYTYMRACVFM